MNNNKTTSNIEVNTEFQGVCVCGDNQVFVGVKALKISFIELFF